MRVFVQRSLGAIDAFDIWFVLDDPVGGKRQIAYFTPQEFGPARLEWQEVGRNEEAAEPTLRLGGFEAHCLKLAFDEHGPTIADGAAMAADAIKVRDRLLTLIEKLTTGNHA